MKFDHGDGLSVQTIRPFRVHGYNVARQSGDFIEDFPPPISAEEREPNGTHFPIVDLTLRVRQAAKRGIWHSSLGE